MRLGCLGGGARNDSHHVVCRFCMCRFAGTQPGGSGLERAGSHARSFLVWDTGVAWAETLSLGAWAALAAVQNAIKGKRWKDFAIVSGRMVRTLWAACLGRRIRNRFWPTGCARQRDQDGWADGWMGGLAKISGGTLHLFQGTWFEPFGQHALRGA